MLWYKRIDKVHKKIPIDGPAKFRDLQPRFDFLYSFFQERKKYGFSNTLIKRTCSIFWHVPYVCGKPSIYQSIDINANKRLFSESLSKMVSYQECMAWQPLKVKLLTARLLKFEYLLSYKNIHFLSNLLKAVTPFWSLTDESGDEEVHITVEIFLHTLRGGVWDCFKGR